MPPQGSRPSSAAIRLGSEAGMTKRESDDPLLEERRELVGRPRPAAFPRPQDLQAVPLDPALPTEVGGAVDAEDTAGFVDGGTPGQIEQLQPVAEEHVIL